MIRACPSRLNFGTRFGWDRIKSSGANTMPCHVEWLKRRPMAGKSTNPGDQVIGGPEGMTHSPQAIIKV